ncbi:MAG: hypothetical protein M1819_006904 [Sarea resinae]|nr:MAG: hypothetical protein M1819_006904 [Sarea resinae]
MEQSGTLMSAQIQFLDTRLSLIHIPLHLYAYFVQPILQLLLPAEGEEPNIASNGLGGDHSSSTWTIQHPFVNISLTPIECSVVCSRESAKELFVPVLEGLDRATREQIAISKEDYVVFQVDGEGLDAGQRVLELTTPLAMAGISIFFITTYFSDYILVPLKSRGQVIHALEDRGFAFEKSAEAFVNQSHHRNTSSSSSFDPVPPSTPPPTTISELQVRTFALLKRRNIVPRVNSDIRLVQCAGRRDTFSDKTGVKEAKLHLGLIKCLVNRPRFLSVTLTDSEAASLLLEQRLLPQFGSDEVLLGSKEDVIIPVTLDLRQLPLEATGIVCGVAGRLVGGTSEQLRDPVEMSYLSTARAGTVMVAEGELDRAMGALRGTENGFSRD